MPHLARAWSLTKAWIHHLHEQVIAWVLIYRDLHSSPSQTRITDHLCYLTLHKPECLQRPTYACIHHILIHKHPPTHVRAYPTRRSMYDGSSYFVIFRGVVLYNYWQWLQMWYHIICKNRNLATLNQAALFLYLLVVAGDPILLRQQLLGIDLNNTQTCKPVVTMQPRNASKRCMLKAICVQDWVRS